MLKASVRIFPSTEIRTKKCQIPHTQTTGTAVYKSEDREDNTSKKALYYECLFLKNFLEGCCATRIFLQAKKEGKSK